jgi:hypothetical protein
MKKNFFYALMSAIALTGAIGFTACSSDSDAVVENNPTYDGTSVRTDFAFNITKASQGTRMTAENVQESSNFRGLEKMFLLPFTGVPGTAATSNAASFDLGTLSGISNPTSSKVYAITIPVGTNNFLFYGVADRNSKGNYQVGAVDHSSLAASTNPVNISDIHFDLKKIADLDKDGDNATNNAKNLAAYLSQIARAKVDDDNTWSGTVDKAKTDGNFRALALLYTKFTKIGASEARSGSAESVRRMILELYKSTKAINDESSNTDVQAMAAKICEAITTAKDNVKVNILQSDGETAVDFTKDNTTNGDPNNWKSTLEGLTGSSVYGSTTGKQVNDIFPANLGLPMGAAQLSFEVPTSGENANLPTFSYKGTIIEGNPTSTTSGQMSVDVANIDYPAELLYFDNSPLLATNKYKEVKDYPIVTQAWDLDPGSDAVDVGGTNYSAFDGDWAKNSAVAATTRAVAMQNNVNYGVALFKTNVKLGTPVSPATGFTDNMAAIVGGSAANQTDINAAQFKVTGLLIGGQPKKIGWNMIRKDEENNSFNQVIYDRDVQYGGNLSTSASTDNYTIVFDNYDNIDDSQDPVLFALEIVNGDKDFYGKDNLIPAGSTFYLVGKLTPATDTEWEAKVTAAARPTTYRITNESVSRIFVQDYTTVANITLNAATALQNAYSTVPDLRSTETVFGLSVDLKWEAGMEFNVTIE